MSAKTKVLLLTSFKIAAFLEVFSTFRFDTRRYQRFTVFVVLIHDVLKGFTVFVVLIHDVLKGFTVFCHFN